MVDVSNFPQQFPYNWYWLHDDGRVYSAPANKIVTVSDQGYVDFLAQGNVATRWPPDAAGQQTDASLSAVINPYNLYLDPKVELHWYAGDTRWRTEVRGITLTVAGAPRAIGTNVEEQSKVADLKTSYDNGARTGTVSFKCADGTFFTAGAADVTIIYKGILDHVERCFTQEGLANAAVTAGTCTTHAQVDAFFASIP